MSENKRPLPLWQSLSRPARLVYWIGPPATVLIALILSPKTAATLPAIALPTIFALRRYRSSPADERADFEDCLWIFLATGVIEIAVAATIQGIVGYGMLYLFHGKETMNFIKSMGVSIKDTPADVVAARIAAAWSWQNVIQRFAFCYVLAGLLEESLKIHPIIYAWRKHEVRGDRPSSIAYLQYAVASGLGLSTMESIMGASALIHASSSWSKVALELGERIVHGTAAHVLMTALASIRFTRLTRQSKAGQEQKRLSFRQWMRTVGPSVLYHGSFNFVLLSISAMNGSLGWEHPKDTKSLMAMYGIGAWTMGMLSYQVWQEWKKLKRAEKEKSS